MTKATLREIHAKNEANPGPMGGAVEQLLAEIERLQSFTRRGSEPEQLPDTAKAKGKPDPRIQQFIDGWCKAFQEHHREKYLVMAKDFPAIKRILAIADVDTLLDRAWEAWKHPDKFNCKQAASVCGFASRYNDIVIELKTISNGGRPPTQPAECRL